MAVRTTEEILNAVKARIGEDTSDEALALIEDIADTLNNGESNDKEDWKKKYEDNDAMWRQKYRDRFFSGGDDKDDTAEEDNDDKPKTYTYENLFKEETK